MITNYVAKDFKSGDQVVLYSKRFNNIPATIMSIKKGQAGKIAIVKKADGEEERVDMNEIQVSPEIPEDIMNQSVEQDNEYRPIGHGTGQDRNAFQAAASAIKGVQKQLSQMKMPIIAVNYESTDQKRWNNSVNGLWEGTVNFNVEFLDINGQKHSATVKVPIMQGQVGEVDSIYDNFNRKFAMTADGIMNFLNHMNWEGEEDPDNIKGQDSIYTIPGQVPDFS